MRRRCRSRAFHAVLLAGCALPALAHAQAEFSRYQDSSGIASDPPPPTAVTMSNQVNVANGQLGISDTYLSIGSLSQGAMSWTYYAGLTQDNLYGAVNVAGSVVTVSLGSQSLSFNVVAAGYATALGDGASLTSGNGVYTLTLRDGTVAVFSTQWGSSNTTQATARVTTITDPKGLVTTFAYKAYTFQKSGVTTTASRLQGVANTLGYAIKYAYQTNGGGVTDGTLLQVTAINEAVEYCDIAADSCSLSNPWPKATLAAAANGEVSVTGPTGLVTTYPVPKANTSQTLTRPSGLAQTFAFDAKMRVKSITTAAGAWTYGYSTDSGQQTTTITDPLNHVQYVTTDGAGNLASLVDALNNTTSYVYDASERLTGSLDADGVQLSYSYDARGNLTDKVKIGKDGSRITLTHASYDATCSNPVKCNEPNSTLDANGAETDYTYNPSSGVVATVVYPAMAGGIRPQTSYFDAQHSATYYTAPGSLTKAAPVWQMTFTARCATAQTCMSTANSVESHIGYGPTSGASNALPIQVYSGSGDGKLRPTSNFTYDNVGNLATSTDPLGHVTRYLYDAARRPVGVIGPDPDGSGPAKNRAVRYRYNGEQLAWIDQGAVASQSDSDWANFQVLLQHQKAYDAAGRPLVDAIVSNGADSSVTQYQYDAANRLQCTAVRMNAAAYGSLPAGCSLSPSGPYGQDRITFTSYDAADRATSVTSGYGTSAARTETTGYTGAGKLAWQQDGDNNRTSYVYDVFDRLSQVQMPSPSQGAGTSNANDAYGYAYDNVGHIVSNGRRGGAVVNYAYDAAGNLTSRSGTNIATVSYGYDVLGRLTSAAGDNTSTYTYDALSRLTGQSGPLGPISLQYDANGNMTRLQWPDGTTAGYGYNAYNETTLVVDPTVVLMSIGYDDLGRRTSVGQATGQNQAWASTSYYGYGSDSRLSSISHYPVGGSGQTLNYWYNAAGQVRSSSGSNPQYDWQASSQVLSRPYGANGLNQYTSSGGAALSYDGQGNLANDTRLAYGYDGLGRLTSLSNGASLSYDAVDNLYLTRGSATNLFLYLGSTIIGEYDAGANVLRRYVPGAGLDETAAWYDGPGAGGYANRRYSLTDRQGSVIAVTNDSGSVLGINTYDDSGNPGSANIGRFQYNGAPWIPEAGLYHMRARDYSTTLGRFMQPDPIGYGDGLNFYNYAHGDPVDGADPSGLEATITGNSGFYNGLSQSIARSADSAYGVSVRGARELIPGAIKAAKTTIPEVVVTGRRILPFVIEANPIEVFLQALLDGSGLDPCDTISCAEQHQKQLTPFGRSLAKHGGRPGGKFPAPKGTPEDINAEAIKLVNEILEDGTSTLRETGRFGEVTDTYTPNGQGVRFGQDGNFIGFLER